VKETLVDFKRFSGIPVSYVLECQKAYCVLVLHCTLLHPTDRDFAEKNTKFKCKAKGGSGPTRSLGFELLYATTLLQSP